MQTPCDGSRFKAAHVANTPDPIRLAQLAESANFSHALRNALASTSAALELIRLGATSTQRSDALNLIQRQIDQMVSLLNPPLTPPTRVCPSAAPSLDLGAIITQLEAEWNRATAPAHPTLVIQGNDTVRPIDASPKRLTRVLRHMLRLAGRLCVQDTMTLSVGSARDSHFLRMIEPARPVDLSTHHQIRRARIVLASLAATLEFKRSLNSFRLEIAIPRSSPDSGVGARLKPAPPAQPDRVRVLVVDDNHDLAHSLACVLRLLGHTAEVAGDGEQALQIARAFRPEVILLDLALPKVDGYHVAVALRDEYGANAPRLIAITGRDMSGDRSRLRLSGIEDPLIKPFDLKDLQNRILAPPPSKQSA